MDIVKLNVVISRVAIQKRVVALAELINRDYKYSEVVLISVLKGAFIFTSDLCRHLTFPVTIDFVQLQSYSGTQSTGIVKLVGDLPNVKNKRVLVVEDIIDTGFTLKKFVALLQEQQPLDIKVCCLLNKPCNRKVLVKVDYYGFEISNMFVVGYGLDFNNELRELPDICEVKSY